MRRGPVAIALALVLGEASVARAVEFQILNKNGPRLGFNDPTPAAPVAGNFGTTVGQQRLIAFQYAGAIWGATLDSKVPIRVDSAFETPQSDPGFTCDASSGVLGFARLLAYAQDPSFPVPGVGYPIALANALSDKDLSPNDAHILARFNAAVGSETCLAGQGWYYGLSAPAASAQVDLVTTVLHEFGHGLGFYSGVNPKDGSFVDSAPAIFDHQILTLADVSHWDTNAAAARETSAVSGDGLAYDGPQVAAQLSSYLGRKPDVELTGAGVPSPVVFSRAAFGGGFSPGFSGKPVQLAVPATACTADGALQAFAPGAVALIDRGGCTFVEKARNAQSAGAGAVIFADNDANDLTPVVPGGSDATITVPIIAITLDEGTQVKSALGNGGVEARFFESAQFAGTDTSNTYLLLYAPDPVKAGSSVSHWESSASPDLLMEFAISPTVGHDLDLTPAVMKDLGWSVVEGLTLSMVKALDPEVIPGRQATYLVVVLNRRATEAAAVSLDLSFPEGTRVEATSGDCPAGFPCALGNIPARTGKLAVVTVTPPTSATNPFVSTARLTAASSSGADRLVAEASQPFYSAVSGSCGAADGEAPAGVLVGLAWLAARRRRSATVL